MTSKTKLAIPVILATTILIAGIFALQPIDKASTVHTQIIQDTMHLISVVQTANPVDGTADVITCTLATASPFAVKGINVSTTTDANTNLDLLAFSLLTTDLSDDPGVTGLAFNPVAADDNFDLIEQDLQDATIIGTNSLILDFGVPSAGDAIDVVTVTFIIEIAGSVTASDFNCGVT